MLLIVHNFHKTIKCTKYNMALKSDNVQEMELEYNLFCFPLNRLLVSFCLIWFLDS